MGDRCDLCHWSADMKVVMERETIYALDMQCAVEQKRHNRVTHARRGTMGVTDSSRLKATLRDMVFQSPPSSFWKHFSIPRSISAITLFFTACVLLPLLLLLLLM